MFRPQDVTLPQQLGYLTLIGKTEASVVENSPNRFQLKFTLEIESAASPDLAAKMYRHYRK